MQLDEKDYQITIYKSMWSFVSSLKYKPGQKIRNIAI
jgi:hypothetical protein